MQERSPVVRFLADNLLWMLGSIALATVVWYVAWSGQNPVQEKNFPDRIPVQFQTDQDLIVVSPESATALVTIRAPQSVWNVLEPEDIGVMADLTNMQPGSHTVALKGMLSEARHGSVVDIQPSQITVEIARRAEQLVNVNVIKITEPPPGFMASFTASDATTKVVGPEDVVKTVVAAQARIDLQDQQNSFSHLVKLIAVDADGNTVNNVQLTPAEITLNVNIQPRPDVTELSVVPQLTGDLPTGYYRRSYSWDPKTVAVRGDRATVDALNGVVNTEPIDLTGKTSSFSQLAKLALPTGVTLPDPVEITVNVDIEPILGSREFPAVPVQPQGLDLTDYSITLHPDHVSVIVNGPESILDTLSDTDITIIAPLNGLPAGTSTVTLQGSIAKPGFSSQDIVIPNAQAQVTIVALKPTPTLTPGPTLPVIPTSIPLDTPVGTGTSS